MGALWFTADTNAPSKPAAARSTTTHVLAAAVSAWICLHSFLCCFQSCVQGEQCRAVCVVHIKHCNNYECTSTLCVHAGQRRAGVLNIRKVTPESAATKHAISLWHVQP